MASDGWTTLYTLPTWTLYPPHLEPGASSALTTRHSVLHGAFIPSGQWVLLTIVIHQPQAVMDPVVRFFSPRLLQGQDE